MNKLFKIGLITGGLILAISVYAAYSGNSSGYAWSEQAGWISFNTTNQYGVLVTDTSLDGYAWGENVGYISLYRDTGTPSYGVTLTKYSDGGKLSGMAWGPQTGFIRMAATSSTYLNTTAANYGVKIASSTGNFSGYAWSEKLGWISFAGSCSSGTTGACSGGTYGVTTSWTGATANKEPDGNLESAVFDTGSTATIYNFIIWQGTQPTDTNVRFQLATSESSDGPWSFVGPDNTSGSYYEPAGPNVSTGITKGNHLHQRYFKYKIFLTADGGNENSPTVTDVIINYTP